jgi:hypothetical protein
LVRIAIAENPVRYILRCATVYLGFLMSWHEYTDNPLWPILVETVHAMVMYPHHKAYTRDSALHEQPDTKPTDLATNLGITLGEALVILYELEKEKSQGKP